MLAAVWSVVVLIVSGLALTALFRQEAISRFDQDLFDVADGLYAGSTVDDQGEVDAPPLTDSRATRAYSGKYWQISEPGPDGKLHAAQRSRSLWDSELKGPEGGLAQLQAHPGQPVYYDTVGPAKEPLRAAAMLARLQGRQAPVVFMAAEDRTPYETDSRRFSLETAAGLVILGVGLVLVVLVQVRIGLQPLFELRSEVADVRTGKAERVSGAYPSELQPLAEELNALVAHDQEVVERQRTHVGNLAHALKTPLSVMLAESERQGGPLAELVGHQAQLMRQQVDHHLRRARAAARTQGSRERTPLEPVMDELAVTLERIFSDKAVEIDWRCPEDLVFPGERQDLLEIVGNLIENACKYGRGRVRAIAAPAGPERMTVTVEDNGAGLSETERAQVLKRGARLDETAPGSGLGLSIVDELARAYDGAVSLSSSPLGGLKVSVELPRA
ncbi:sensor histidine kinase [Phenylobacterium montanum]|uniref:histidine kinase n=1 Tax=Phenylobacterium montanum TaxID=2823693 RepID=A0A975G4L3_9CAUL|nr:ATP-binding protein [Caulobacter sp. S6]QUD90775.1 sensor histidine kinase N-terminal domain-containing protein [Caulobacter sp. S6]